MARFNAVAQSARRKGNVGFPPQQWTGGQLAQNLVTLEEKKCNESRLTIRRVPLTLFLKDVLADWMFAAGHLTKITSGRSITVEAILDASDLRPQVIQKLLKIKWKTSKPLDALWSTCY